MEWGFERLRMGHRDTTNDNSPEACHGLSWAIVLVSWNIFSTSNSITVVTPGEGGHINKV